jgi:hypothetical protein
MNLRTATVSAICVALALAGCDKNPLGTIESQGHPPEVSGVSLTPNVVRIDSITPANGLYHLRMSLFANVTDADGAANIQSVQADIVDPTGNHIAVADLHDDGTAPDAVRGDGLYSARLDVPISNSLVGRFYPYVTATDGSGLQSNSVSTSFLVFRRNSIPKIFNLLAPDTVQAEPGSTVAIPMSVAASDSDGLADIKEVYFRSLDSRDPNAHFQLLDDGGGSNGTSGDKVAGDGIFSVVIGFNAASSTGSSTYRFVFQARDATGDTSNSIFHTLHITGL